jgi:hypothetical protein
VLRVACRCCGCASRSGSLNRTPSRAKPQTLMLSSNGLNPAQHRADAARAALSQMGGGSAPSLAKPHRVFARSMGLNPTSLAPDAARNMCRNEGGRGA